MSLCLIPWLRIWNKFQALLLAWVATPTWKTECWLQAKKKKLQQKLRKTYLCIKLQAFNRSYNKMEVLKIRLNYVKHYWKGEAWFSTFNWLKTDCRFPKYLWDPSWYSRTASVEPISWTEPEFVACTQWLCKHKMNNSCYSCQTTHIFSFHIIQFTINKSCTKEHLI